MGKRHYLSQEKLYFVWKTMRQRCFNKKQHDYKWYGALGISVCQEWDNPVNFIEWAKANGYKEGLTLDRIDYNKNYEPSNCRWITIEKQQLHKRNNHYITYKNETHSIPEWAEILGMSNQMLYFRIVVRHWDIEKAFTTPPIAQGKYIREKKGVV